MDTEEKRTDVNIATWLLIDAHSNDFEQALLISNDSDLALPVRLTREMLNRPVGVVNPNTRPGANTPVALLEAATFVRHLRKPTLRTCQLPQQLSDARGNITKPSAWN